MLQKNKFPSKTELTRIKTLGKFEDLYDNNQRAVLPLHDLILKQYEASGDVPYLAHAIPSKISDFYGDFVQGDVDRMTFEYTGDESGIDTFDKITEDNDVEERINDWATEQSLAGYVMLLGYKDAEGKFLIQEVDQDQYFPQSDGSVVFASYFRDYTLTNEAVVDEEAPKRMYTQEYTLVGEDVTIARKVWSTDTDGTILEDLGEEAVRLHFDVDSEETLDGIGQLPIVQIDNGRRTRWGFGKSDYNDVMPQIGEINERRTHIATQLLKNLDAKIELADNEDLKNPDGSLKNFEFVMRPDNETPETRYITNDNPLIEASEIHISSQLKMISYVSDVPMWALNDSSAPEKVESMKIKLFGAIRKTTRKRAKMKKGIKKLYAIGFKMLDVEMGKDSDIVIEFSDVLPNDDFIDAQTEQVKVEAGITSKRSSMRRLEDYSEEELDAEIEQIKKEEVESGALNPNDAPVF